MSFASSIASSKSKTIQAVVCIARAGCGKTFTSCEAATRILWERGTKGITGTKQQEQIWQTVQEKFSGCSTILATTFSKALVDELKTKVPPSVHAQGLHSFGFAVVRKHLKVKQSNFATENILRELYGEDFDQWREKFRKDSHRQTVVKAVKELVSKVKVTLADVDSDGALLALCEAYEININDSASEVFDLTKQVISKVKEDAASGDLSEIEFDDMVWLPVAMNWTCKTFDLTIADEVQDFNACQAELMMKTSKQFMLVGDDKQAIFAFAGAQSNSIDQVCNIIESHGGNVETLKLTTSFRCSKAVAKEAAKIVPDFEAMPNAIDGAIIDTCESQIVDTVSNIWNQNPVHDQLMVICRTNAPIVSLVFQLIKAGIPAYIQGRDMINNLVTVVKASKCETVGEFMEYLQTYRQKKLDAVSKKPNAEQLMITINDRVDILEAFAENSATCDDIIDNIYNLFSTGEKSQGRGKAPKKLNAVKLTSAHRSKGLEAEHTIILQPEQFPHPMAIGTKFEDQESHLFYVAISRARNTLTYCHKVK